MKNLTGIGLKTCWQGIWLVHGRPEAMQLKSRSQLNKTWESSERGLVMNKQTETGLALLLQVNLLHDHTSQMAWKDPRRAVFQHNSWERLETYERGIVSRCLLTENISTAIFFLCSSFFKKNKAIQERRGKYHRRVSWETPRISGFCCEVSYLRTGLDDEHNST